MRPCASSSITAQPNSKRVVVNGLVLTLSKASATFLNLVFPNNSGDPARDFRTGDLFGTATMTVKTR